MSYALADLLDDGIIPGAQLLTKPLDFANVMIDTVGVQEYPVDNFPQKNELVLTSAIGCYDDDDKMLNLIKEMLQAQVATIILSFKHDYITVPVSVINCANAMDIPIFLIPWELRFSTIQAAVLKKINERHSEIYQTLQKHLFSLFFASHTLNDAAVLIASVFNITTTIVDSDYRLMGSSVALTDDLSISDPPLAVPVHIGQVIAGYLCFFPDSAVAPLPDLNNLKQFISPSISLWFNLDKMEDFLTMKLKNDFVWDLSNGNYTSMDEMMLQGKRLKFDLQKPYTCIIIKAVSASGAASAQRYSNNAIIHSTDIETLIISSCKERHLSFMIGDRGLEYIVYVENAADKPSVAIDTLVNNLDICIKNSFPFYDFFWGISETTLKPPDFTRLYKDASFALQQCLNLQNKVYRYTYLDTKEAKFISILSESTEVQKIAHETLDALLEFDSKSGIDAIATLTEFFKCNYHINQTAKNLRIHRQSLLYRLGKIEKLTALSLHNHRDLVLLELCIRVLQD